MMGPIAGFCEYSDEASISIKAVNFMAKWINVNYSRRLCNTESVS
jgi:hypothetical protein